MLLSLISEHEVTSNDVNDGQSQSDERSARTKVGEIKG